jgi:hypothetical protein
VKPNLILAIHAHFLVNAKFMSPVSKQYVIREMHLVELLKTQLKNRPMITRLFNIFAIDDPFGLKFEEFLLVRFFP